MNRKAIEKEKERLQDQYETAVVNLYLDELRKIFPWFKRQFPKRRLRWVSAMGSCFWEIDGEILNWDAVVPTYDSRCYQTGWKEPKPGRKERTLIPLWEFYMSITDHTNYTGTWIDTGDFTMETPT